MPAFPQIDGPAAVTGQPRLAEWLDGQSRRLFVLPAVLLILAFSVFPLIASLYLSMTRLRFAPGGYDIDFVGLSNYARLLFGSEQFHFLGRFGTLGVVEIVTLAVLLGALGFWFVRYLVGGRVTVIGLVGRTIFTALAAGLIVLGGFTLSEDGQLGSLGVTLFYVIAGCSFQFAVGLGLALLCVQPIRGRSFFRLVFFVPLMVTPVGIAYTVRMLADMVKGPFAPIWSGLGLAEFAWASDPWSARLVVMIGDSWQWIPFIFVVMLAALENLSRDQIEAAQVDGAGGWQIFRDITWPGIAPVAATVVLIRVIEAFKIIDLPNVLTNGGPGIATESMTLHSFMAWRTLNLGGSAAVAYMLMFVSVVLCVSFFNLIVIKQRARLS